MQAYFDTDVALSLVCSKCAVVTNPHPLAQECTATLYAAFLDVMSPILNVFQPSSRALRQLQGSLQHNNSNMDMLAGH